MPGPITYAAVALMARDRVRSLQRRLKAKQAHGRFFSEAERHLLVLSERALAIVNNAPAGVSAPTPLYGPARGDQLSKFLLMGAIGPELPGYAAFNAKGQRWLRDTLHKGTPDANREQVLAGSTDLPLAFWRKVDPLLPSRLEGGAEKNADRLAMQAYVLGHFAHVATDVVSAPWIDNLAWMPGRAAAPPNPALPKLSREAVVGAIESEVARVIFGRGSGTRGSHWVDWFPTAGQVPDAFYTAMQQALEELYGPGAVRVGGAAYELQRADDKPPPLSSALLKDGYESFRTVMDVGVAWDYWDWLGATWFMYVPALVAYPMVLALPHGKNHLREVKPADHDDGAGLFELISLPFAVNAASALYAHILATTSYLGAESEVIFGWVSTGVQLVALIAFLASLEAGGSGLAPRWVLLFGLPLVLQIIEVVLIGLKGSTNPRRRQLMASILIPVGLSLLFLALYFGDFHKGIEAIAEPPAGQAKGDGVDFAWRFVVWFLLLFGLWWLVALALRFINAQGLPDDVSNARAGRQRHGLRLFDDTALLRSPVGVSPALDALFYPSGRRALLKLWWSGDGTVQLRHLGDRLEFLVDGASTMVPVPPAPMTASEFAAYLQTQVLRGGAQGLVTELAHTAGDALEDAELAPGSAFVDAGDPEDLDDDKTVTVESLIAARTAAASAKTLNAPGGDAVLVFHAHKAAQAVRFDRLGASTDVDETTAAAAGVGTVTSLLNTRTVTLAPGPGVSRFTRFFRPGDLIEAPAGGGVARIVEAVSSDFELTVSTPFPPAAGVTSVPPGTAFARLAMDPRQPIPSPAGAQINTGVDAVGTCTVTVAAGAVAFGAMFRAGDTIRVHMVAGNPAADQSRLVVQVLSDTTMLLESEFDILSPPSIGPFTFERVGREPEHLLPFVAGADDGLDSGDAVMNEAADLATLLCLAATSRLMPAADLAKGAFGGARDLNPVAQVFRNWNLDRRRQNEWKMLVQGEALSEKRGDAAAADPALSPLPAGWQLRVADGEDTSNSLGWARLLRAWSDMAGRPEQDALADTAFRPGQPSNRKLTRALAYLFDMPEPTV
ncbi:membrane hypothetical protein [Rubrivivax sp. A210]|uniref:hypothetical protein n=1 Tax=Rubrivivax sp. A210 TaxID=2772301 RepID=UPI001917AD79|nr:hypothetical protein [Rubrivivax sp. A210]CAD5366052.1 membrane hypothetical protein [Rubrivivax sp. A210]